MTVYAAIGAMFALMGGIVYYASLDNTQLEQVEVELANISVREVNTVENRAKLEVTFLVKNPSEKTFTVPVIGYKLFADGVMLGSGQYSTEDIAMPGRAVFYPGSEIPLKNTFVLNRADVSQSIYDAVLNEQVTTFSAEGNVTSETSWSIVEKDFVTEMN
ncbi:MAG: hypothetical protein OXC46_06355 [Thaumarchaeota archaeon]|nr:hypothetical protein [Nitrososphaerota archaeon]